MNGNSKDDFALANNASAIVGAIDFGNSYKVGGTAEGCRDGDVSDDPGECLDSTAYNELCSLIESSCFENCRALNFSTPGIIQNCVFDMCITEGNKKALEQAVEEYATRCQEAGVTICDWRDVADLPLDCQANSHYESEGPGCPNTCLDKLAAERCTLPRVGGCVCNDGYVLSGTKCVPLAECGCARDGQYYEQGETYLTAGCTANCVCNNQVISCTANTCQTGEVCKVSPTSGELGCVPQSFGQCQALGDPHYTSLDGKRFDFQGSCNYTFFNATNPVTGVHWLVVTDNQFLNGNTRVSWLKSVFVFFTFHGRYVKVALLTDSSGKAFATVYNLLNETFTTYGGVFGGVKFIGSGRKLTLQYKDVTVSWAKFRLVLKIPGVFAGKTSGLCGNFNGDASDDFITAGGNATMNVNVFGQSHQFGSCGAPVPPEPVTCSTADTVRWSGNEFCGKLSAAFSSCTKVNRTSFVEDCVYDLCQTGDMSIITSYLEILVEKCRETETPLCGWHNATGTPVPVCPDGSSFRSCVSACPDTCQEPGASEVCDLPITDRCVCDFGYILHGGKCIKSEECPCFPPGRAPVDQGFEETDSNCTKRCGCNGPNKWECTTIECVGEQECLAVGSSYQCVEPSSSCIIWEGSYISTFDQVQYNFDGTCEYIVVKAYKGASWPEFGLSVDRSYVTKSGKLGMKASLVIYPDENHNLTFISMATNFGHVMYNGQMVLPGSQVHGMTVGRQGNFMVATFKFGLTVRMNAYRGMVVTVGGSLHNNLHGLCGNNDKNKYNEFMSATGNVTSIIEFGNSWQYYHKVLGVPEPNCRGGRKEDEELDRCPRKSYLNYIRGSRACALLQLPLFAKCNDIVKTEVLQKACALQLCYSDNFIKNLFSLLTGYIVECQARGGEFPDDFSSVLGLTQICPNNSHFTNDLEPCQPSCSDPEAKVCKSIKALVTAPIQSGCMCDNGYTWSGNQCVPLSKCGCSFQGLYYLNGFCSYDVSCRIKCQCRGGLWDCEYNPCRSDQYCGQRDGEWGCHSTDECKYNNGGCSYKCKNINGTAMCICPMGEGLAADGKQCVALMGGSTCLSILAQWKVSYNQWQSVYNNEWKKVYSAWKAGKRMSSEDCPETWTFPDEEMTSSCSANWTKWFDTDNSTGCGDDETLERILALYPGAACKNPVAMEKRVVATRGPAGSLIPGPVLRHDSPSEGLLCDNSDQETGRLCPDYAVRFLCLK